MATFANTASPVVPVATPVAGPTLPLTGVDPAYARIRAIPLDTGRFVAGPDELVIAAATAVALFGTPEVVLGRAVIIRDVPCAPSEGATRLWYHPCGPPEPGNPASRVDVRRSGRR